MTKKRKRQRRSTWETDRRASPEMILWEIEYKGAPSSWWRLRRRANARVVLFSRLPAQYGDYWAWLFARRDLR